MSETLPPLPTGLVGLNVAEAERRARREGWEVQVRRWRIVYPAGPYVATRTLLHVGDDDIVLQVSRG